MSAPDLAASGEPDAGVMDSGLNSREVKRRVFTASIWSFLSATGGQATSFAIFAVLARLLSPRDFGLVAFAAVFIDLSRSVILGGIPETLIQRPAWTERAANTAFWLNMMGSLAFCLLAAAGVLGFAHYGRAGPAGWVFLALSSTLVIDGLRAVQEAWLRRNFNYKLLAARTVYATMIGGVAGIAAALAGWGVWALVANRFVVSVSQTVILWNTANFRPRLEIAREEVRPLVTFSTQVLGARLLGQLNGRLPDFVIGSVAGPAALGLYRIGSRSLNFFTQSFMTPLQSTTLSAFARLREPGALARAYRRFSQLSATVTFPTFFGSAVIAPDFVRVCFGERWHASAPIMAVLSLTVLPTTLLFFFQPTLQAAGRPKRAIGSEAGRLAVGVVLVSGLSMLGPLAAAVGDTARRYVSLPQYLKVLREEIGLSGLQLVRAISVPLCCAMVMAGLTFALQHTLLLHTPAVLRLAASVVFGGLVYVALMVAFGRRFLIDVLESLRHGLPARVRPPVERLLRLLGYRADKGAAEA